MKATIDNDLCTACGLCSDLCPEVFELEDEYAVVIATPVPEDQEDCTKDAAEQCPTEAIIIE